jgi:hypothetical protein
MPVKTRSNTGRFVATTDTCDDNNDSPLNLPVQKETMWKILKLILLFLVVSPWLFLALRKNNIDNFSKKIGDFYDDNFSCNSYCSKINFDISQDSTAPEKGLKVEQGGEKILNF